jgi:general secretion pathway protein G
MSGMASHRCPGCGAETQAEGVPCPECSQRQGAGKSPLSPLVILGALLCGVALFLAIWYLPWVQNRSGRASGDRMQAHRDIASLSTALNSFRLDCDRYPTDQEGLAVLMNAAPPVSGWRGPYLEKAPPDDPWGRPYVYKHPGASGADSFTVTSYGSDGRPGGTEDAADIGSHEP